MRKRDVAGAGLVSVTLGAIGCGEPARPPALDAAGLFAQHRVEAGEAWRRYLEPQALHAAWAPAAGSVWRPYYKPTLIAAVAVVKDAAGPLQSPEAKDVGDLASRIDLKDAAVFIDLPGELSVAWGAALAAKGLQPVVTFNNWPHQKGLLKLERALGALIFHAEQVAAKRPSGAAPPVFLLERGRLGDKGLSTGPEVFDNRWFHAATDFPDATRLQQQGVKRIVYVNAKGSTAGAEEDDLSAYFAGLRTAGLRFTYVWPTGKEFQAGEVEPLARATIFDPAPLQGYASSGGGHYHRPYAHYYHYHSFWRTSSGTWGSGSSGGGGSSGWSS